MPVTGRRFEGQRGAARGGEGRRGAARGGEDRDRAKAPEFDKLVTRLLDALDLAQIPVA